MFGEVWWFPSDCLSQFYSKWEYFIDGLLNVGITIMVCRRALNNVDALAAEGVLV